mgnify:CR=1 FL=1
MRAGTVGGDNTSPLSAWYMGAFGNNYVDDREIKRYREYDSFPGFESTLQALGADLEIQGQVR